MTMQDFRGQGPPGDIGTFQFSSSVIVYKVTFSGTTYTCAARRGDRGWVLVPNGYGTNSVTVINAALVAGKDVYLAEGTYDKAPADVIVMYVNNRLHGANWNATVINATGAPGAGGTVIRSENPGVLDTDYIVIEDLTITCGGISGPGIDIQGHFLVVKRVQVNTSKTNTDGIRLRATAAGSPIVTIINSKIVDCGQDGINADGPDSHVVNCVIQGCARDGIAITGSDWGIINCHVFLNSVNGMNLTGKRYRISECYIDNNSHNGIVMSSSDCTKIVGTQFDKNGFGTNNTYASLDVLGGTGLAVVGCVFMDQNNHVRDGIRAETAVTNFTIAGNTFAAGHQTEGIGPIGSDWTIVGNNFKSMSYGIYCYSGLSKGLIADNVFQSCTTGIRLEVNCDNNFIVANLIDTATTGIVISGATCDNNRIGHNEFITVTTCLDDTGTGTILPTLLLPFVDGTLSVTADAAPKGWSITLATNFALALGVMPPNCHQSVRMKVHAISLAAEADGMRLQVTADACQPDEAWDAEHIDITKTSTTLNFAANDGVIWTLTPADDADVDDLIAGDQIEIKAIYAAATGADIATNALLRCVEIQYV